MKLFLSSFILLVLLTSSVFAQHSEPEVHGVFFDEPMYTVLPAGAIPAIDDPEFVTGDEADAQMSSDELIMGIVMDGEARAYSTWQLDAHEIVNDEIDGIPFAVCW